MTESRRCNLAVSALVIRKIEFAESDLIVHFLTDTLGQISVLARAARSSKRRFSGGIEPFHSLLLQLDQPQHGELFRLRGVQLQQPRFNLVTCWAALAIAGRALGWVRRTTATRTPEPEIFQACCALLDRLDGSPPANTLAAEASLCEFGLQLLSLLGWQLQLERCVRCARACPSNSPATLDPRHGGLVCQHCGGAKHLLSADLRRRMIAASLGADSAIGSADVGQVLDIVEDTLLVHTGIEH